jgi:hypothetical protein
MKKSCLVASMLLGLSVTPSMAQMIDGSAVGDILTLAQGYGNASLETQPDGAPRIAGEAGGIPYQVFFLNCAEGFSACEDLNFYAGFAGIKPTLDEVNAWNRDKRFGNAYLDADLDAALEFDLNLQYGVSRDNLDAAFALWSLVLGSYAEYVGYSQTGE